jgi:hypothetical protein
MNKMKKLAFAALAVVGMSGCASTQIAELAAADAVRVPVAEPQVIRPLQSYGSMGGYRYRRFAAVAAAS